jgi:uncharacterized protein (TIGR03435 family)
VSIHIPSVHIAVAAGRAVSAIASFGILTCCILAQSQTAAEDPLTFDVASVKAAQSDAVSGIIHQLPGNQTYEIKAAPLRLIMTVAYQVTDRQISGGPSWIGSDRFDITAKAARPRTSDELHAMLAHLVEERFQLKVRRENRQESVMALVVDKSGSRMPVHDPEDKVHEPIGGSAVRGSDGLLCPQIDGRNVTMNYFAFFLSRALGRAVIDKTQLPAAYDVKVQFVGEGARMNGPDGQSILSPDCPDISAALPKQIGLKLEPAKGAVEYLVVEHAEKPTDN